MAKVKKPAKTARRNPVAKHAGRVNKPAVHKDKKKAQKRGELGRGQRPEIS